MQCARRAFYFERSCPEQRPRAALKPQEHHSSWPGPRAPPPRSSRVAESRSWSRAGKAAAGQPGVTFEVGKAVLTLHPPPTPLRSLSHNANPVTGPKTSTRRSPITATGPIVDQKQRTAAAATTWHLAKARLVRALFSSADPFSVQYTSALTTLAPWLSLAALALRRGSADQKSKAWGCPPPRAALSALLGNRSERSTAPAMADG
jgi:hypothetical protein